MGLYMLDAGDITVASGDTDSDSYKSHWDADAIRIESPAVLAETANLQVSVDGGTTWKDADSTDAALGAAGVAVDIRTFYLIGLVRVHLNGAAAADRTFKVFKRVVQ